MNTIKIRELHIFDFCGTITKNQTADDFVKFLVSPYIRLKIKFFILKILQKYINRIFKRQLLNKKNFLKLIKGFTNDLLEEEAFYYSNLLIHYYMREDILELIRVLVADKSKKVIILSAGYSIYIKHIARILGIEEYYASNILVLNHRSNGRYDRSLYGPDKFKFLKEYLMEYSKVETYFYSDSISDLMCLKFVDNPMVVYPDVQLFEHSKNNRWRIIDG
jgi:HAD superfamily hydrolase (TIGR01490 family)